MTNTRRRPSFAPLISVAAFAVLTLWSATAAAQEKDRDFLDNLFTRGEPAQSPQAGDAAERPRQSAQTDNAELAVRLDRMENALRQLTGTIEQLQYRNQQLEIQVKRMQNDAEYRVQQLGAKGGGAGAPPASINAPGAPAAPTMRGQRGDAFDPAQHSNAPGAPRVLGNQSVSLPPQSSENVPPVGPSGGRLPGAPLDLADAGAGTQLATLPPSATPEDEYDLAYGYVLHKDYALAEQAFRDFLIRYPNEHMIPDAQYWLGEVLFQQQRYREAAESFLAVSTKHENTGKAPDSLLRLGQSLVALQKKEAACATFAEVGRKYPRASAGVKHGVAQELKRVHC
jgi:tol-pal system protein YbgF